MKIFDILEILIKKIGTPLGLTDREVREIKIKLQPTLQTLDAYIAIALHPIQLFSEIEKIFPLKSAAQNAASEYGKEVEVIIAGGEVPIPKQILKRLPRLITHLLNNAIVHGIESPEIRQAAGKSPRGKIILQASYQENKAVISFSDDGSGINMERVKAKAISKGLLSASKAASIAESDVYEFLFHPDFSTKDIRDMRAGTGYGLDIVRSELHKIGGNIQVSSCPNQGTLFTIAYLT